MTSKQGMQFYTMLGGPLSPPRRRGIHPGSIRNCTLSAHPLTFDFSILPNRAYDLLYYFRLCSTVSSRAEGRRHRHVQAG